MSGQPTISSTGRKKIMNNVALAKISTEILNQRYQIIDLLGEGGNGKTYRAVDPQTNKKVAIKILNTYGMPDWKTLELFEREVKILSQLDHPAIPRYLDFFRATIAGNETLCLVQGIAPGRTLSAWIAAGHVFTEEKLQNIAAQVLEILKYLQSFAPPIIHRDIKPQNILLTGTGEVYLVDFGAVRDTYNLTITGGSTIVGTYGYMAPEQTRGQAVLASDLYGLGATLLYLKSGEDPADLPVKQMKIDFRGNLKFSSTFATWLDGLLAPFPEDRYSNASVALDYLQGGDKISDSCPRHALTQISQEGETMVVNIPAVLLNTQNSKKTFFVIMAMLLGAFLFLIFKLETSGTNFTAFTFLPMIMSFQWIFLIYPLYSIFQYYLSIMYEHEITIDRFSLTHATKRGGKRVVRKNIPIGAIKFIRCIPGGLLWMTHCVTISGEDINHCFGRHLDFPEQRWIAHQIKQHCAKFKE
jgi:eukaryotic-like serine/threonine-protein kinase